MRMLGKMHPSWCPQCHAPSGLDCPNKGKTVRQVKRAEKRRWKREVRSFPRS